MAAAATSDLVDFIRAAATMPKSEREDAEFALVNAENDVLAVKVMEALAADAIPEWFAHSEIAGSIVAVAFVQPANRAALIATILPLTTSESALQRNNCSAFFGSIDYSAEGALAAIRDTGVIPALCALTSDPDGDVQTAVFGALGTLAAAGEPADAAPILELVCGLSMTDPRFGKLMHFVTSANLADKGFMDTARECGLLDRLINSAGTPTPVTDTKYHAIESLIALKELLMGHAANLAYLRAEPSRLSKLERAFERHVDLSFSLE